MIATQKDLAGEALDKALEVREEAGLAFNTPLCVFGLCESLGVRVQFVDINMEGLYSIEKSPLIMLSVLRPQARRVFNCGHELGHHVFEHGFTLDELQAQETSNGHSDPNEFLADAFSGFLLMPPQAVRRAFADRKWNVAQATPEQVYRIACMFGVGYETMLTHLSASLRLLPRNQADTLRKIRLPQIRRSFLGDDTAERLVVIDEHHLLPTVDVEVGTHLLLPPKTEAESERLQIDRNLPSGRLFKAMSPGLVRVEAVDGQWAAIVRISRFQYTGWSKYRHLEETGDE